MALVKQRIPIPLNIGVNSKVDKKVLGQSGNQLVRNFVQQQSGTLSKVNGFDKIASFGSDGLNIFKLETYKDELLILSSYALYSYNSTNQALLKKGELINVTVENKSVIANSYEQTNAHCAINSLNQICYVWDDSFGGVWYLVKDLATGLTTTNATQITADSSLPNVYAIDNRFYIVVWNDAIGEHECYRLTQSGLESPHTLTTSADLSAPLYSLCLVGSKAVMAFLNNAGSLTLIYVDGSGAIGSDLSGSVDPVVYTAATNVQSFDLSFNSDLDLLSLSFYDTSAGVMNTLLYTNFEERLALQVIDSDVVSDKPNITSVYNEISGSFEIFIEYAAAAAINHYIKRATVDVASGSASFANGYIYSLGLATKAIRIDNVTRFLGVYESASNLQNTYFLIGSNENRNPTTGSWGTSWGTSWGGYGVIGIPEARILPDSAYGHPAQDNLLPNIVGVSSTELLIPVLKQNRIVSSNLESLTLTGIEQCDMSLSTRNIGPAVELGQNLHIPGGYLKIYDGEQLVEHNFHLWPDTLSTSLSSGAGNLSNGTYQYMACYEWIDAKGQIHRSAPSIAWSCTVTGGPKDVNVVIPCLRVTQKLDTQIGVYRTTAGGTLFYKVSSDTAPTYSVTSSDTVTFIDSVADADLTSRALLYTAAQLENYSPTSSNVCASYQNRLFIADKNELFYTRSHFVGEATNFNPALYVSVPSEGGDIVSLDILDEKFIVFKKRSIYILTGQGPDDVGRDANYSLVKLNSDVGCVSAESVVVIPTGLLFKSTKGFYLLDRGLTTSYIGASVEEFNDYAVKASQVTVDKNLVRILLEGTTTQLVYDYFHNLWTTCDFAVEGFSNVSHGVNNKYVFATSEGVYEETEGYSFDGSPISSCVETGWINFAGLSGVQRIYKFGIVGNLSESHTLSVKVYYDYNEDYSESYSISATAGEEWGAEAIYGDDDYFGSTSQVNYLYEVKPSRQKCTSMKIRIEDSFADAVGTAGLSLNALVLTVGVKQGGNTDKRNLV